MYQEAVAFKKQKECKVYCACHNICIHGQIVNQSQIPNHIEFSHFLDFNDTCNKVQKIKNGSIKLSNCSSVAVTPGGTNPSCQMEVSCLECNTSFHVSLPSKSYHKSNNFFCQKQNNNIINDRSKKRSYSAEGSMGSIYAESLPSSMRLLFERQGTDFDTFGFLENEFEADHSNVYYESDFEISNDYDQDYDIMFSNNSESLVEGFSDLGKYMFDNDQIGCLLDA